MAPRVPIEKSGDIAVYEVEEEAEPVPQPMVQAIVARGRSVIVPTGKRKVVGQDKDGNRIYGPTSKMIGPNQQIMLPADEVKSLRDLGYLFDPDKIAPPSGEGPKFSQPASRYQR
jgi:hypothetical protein